MVLPFLPKNHLDNDNELDMTSSNSISDIYGNPVYIIVPSTVNLLNMPKPQIKNVFYKIKVVDLSNTPDGFTNLDTSNALYKPHYYTINNKIIIDYYFDSNIYFKSPQTATDMILRIEQDFPIDDIKINNRQEHFSPPNPETWSLTYNSTQLI